MPDLRKDPVLSRWVIVADAGDRGPLEDLNKEERERDDQESCPFCPGRESMTGKQIAVYGPPDEKKRRDGWQVRVVPNQYPLLRIEEKLERRAEGIYDWLSGFGAHEVLIETPDHLKKLHQLSPREFELVTTAYRDRMRDLKKDMRIVFAIIFKNEGRRSGAKLSHSHSQLIALPITPRNVSQEMDGAEKFFAFRERCIFCDIVEQELADRKRVLDESENFLSLQPYAPRFPFETWVMPKEHYSHYEEMPAELSAEFAALFQLALKRIALGLKNPAYNYLIHTTPFNKKEMPWYHWHVEIMPRLMHTAGFERGSGFYINPVPPEEAAEFLRKVKV